MAPPNDDQDDARRAKDVLAGELDASTQADLERWFGLPSYQELADKHVEVEDPEVAAVRERRQKAIDAVDPGLLEAHRKRTDPPDNLFRFVPNIVLTPDPSIAQLDMQMIERQGSVADAREIEIDDAIAEDLRECTPQAILRDLHRPELDFEKQFEVVDMVADQRFDIVAEVSTLMATRWSLAPSDFLGSSFDDGRALILELSAQRRESWPKLLAAQTLPNRKWSPEDDR